MSEASTAVPPLRENRVNQNGIVSRISTIWEYRELLANLTRRELKVRYKGSILGFFWTLLNPLLYLAIFSIVFSLLLENTSIPFFAVFLLSALLPFNLFSQGLTAATTSITGNGPLVQKVWFPREILPLAAIGSSLVTFLFQLIILAAAMLVFQIAPAWELMWMLIPALLLVTGITVGLGLMLSAVNVYYRDVQHFLELALLVMFWFTPIVYAYSFLANERISSLTGLGDRLGMANPISPIVVVFRRVLYNPTNFERTDADGAVPAEGEWVFDIVLRDTWWHLQNLSMSAVFCCLVVYLGFKVFSRLEANLGEEI